MCCFHGALHALQPFMSSATGSMCVQVQTTPAQIIKTRACEERGATIPMLHLSMTLRLRQAQQRCVNHEHSVEYLMTANAIASLNHAISLSLQRLSC